MISYVAYNRLKQPVRSFDSPERAKEFIRDMKAQGSSFTLKTERLPRHASN